MTKSTRGLGRWRSARRSSGNTPWLRESDWQLGWNYCCYRVGKVCPRDESSKDEDRIGIPSDGTSAIPSKTKVRASIDPSGCITAHPIPTKDCL